MILINLEIQLNQLLQNNLLILSKEKYTFNQIRFTADVKNIDHFAILDRAFKLKMLDVDETEKNILFNFINSTKGKSKFIKSQLYQDVFADFLIENNYDKTFLEFGATDGIDLSNTHFLENYSKWKGVLGEPDPQWYEQLKKNRPDSKIITKCIWKKTGETLDFLSSENGVLSTINSFKYSDKDSMSENSKLRNKKFKNFKIESVSLNDLIRDELNDIVPSYISVDTEGSEFEILKNFDFKKYQPIFFTVEHNYTSNQKNIDELMITNDYVRIFRKITSFDAWYVLKDALDYK